MIIKFSETKTDTQGERPLVLKRIINQSHTDRISLTWVSLYGRHEKVVNDISDRVYYIVDGEAGLRRERRNRQRHRRRCRPHPEGRPPTSSRGT